MLPKLLVCPVFSLAFHRRKYTKVQPMSPWWSLFGAAIGAAGGAAIQAGAEEAVKYLFDLGADLGANWRPVVFGQWYSAKIAKLLAEQTSD